MDGKLVQVLLRKGGSSIDVIRFAKDLDSLHQQGNGAWSPAFLISRNVTLAAIA